MSERCTSRQLYGWFVLGLCLPLLAAGEAGAQRPKKPAFSPAVEKAVVAARGQVGSYVRNIDGTWSFALRAFNPETLPGIQFQAGTTAADLGKLPVIGVPFGVHLTGVEIGPEHLKALARQKNLKALSQDRTRMHAKELKALGKLPNLEVLLLPFSPLNDDDLKAIAGLKKLKMLSVWGATGVTDAGVEALVALKGLEAVNVYCDKVTASGVAKLKGLTGLRVLSVSSGVLTDDGVSSLVKAGLFHKISGVAWDAKNQVPASMDAVDRIDLLNRGFGVAGLRALAGCKNLTRLDVRSTKLAGAELKELSAFPKLRHLSLAGKDVTDASLKELAALPALEEVYLAGTAITPAGLKALQKAPRLRLLYMDQVAINDAVLAAMAETKQLHRLSQFQGLSGRRVAKVEDVVVVRLGGTKVTAACLDSLKAIPNLQSLSLPIGVKLNAAQMKDLKARWPKCTVFNSGF